MVRKHKKMSINYRPLQTSGGIEIVGSVPYTQVYQADKKEYTPDYSLTPLTLFPRCNATDPDAVVVLGCVNSKLVNMKWHERIGTTRTLITSANTGYAITETGTSKGQIQVRKNSNPVNPITLEFYAEYVDTRTGQTHVYRFTQLDRAVDGTDAIPTLMIDSPSTLDWNPCREQPRQTITAKLMVGDMDVTLSSKCRFFFYRILPGTGALELIVDGNGDNDFEVVSVNKNVLVIDRDYIGPEQTYIVKASYAQEGSPSATPDAGMAPVSTYIRRRISNVECDWEGVPQDVSDGTKIIHPKPLIWDTVGMIPNPSAHFNCKWSVKLPGASTETLAATGYAPAIPFTDGMMLYLDVEDRGPYCAAASGSAFVFSGSKLVVARKNG